MKEKIIGNKIIHLEKIPSTNLYAKQILKDKIPEGTVIVADVQTKGRGRKNRHWSSPKGGLWFSVVLYPDIPPEQGMLLTMVASVSVAQAIEEVSKIKPVIKWPNDLLVDGKKVCGILTELETKPTQINYAVVGIGINVNNRIDVKLKDIAISLKQAIGSQVSKVKLLQAILKYFNKNYSYFASKNFAPIRNAWFSYAKIIGKKIKVQDEETVIKGVVCDVDDSGHLILDTKNGLTRIVNGDISFL